MTPVRRARTRLATLVSLFALAGRSLRRARSRRSPFRRPSITRRCPRSEPGRRAAAEGSDDEAGGQGGTGEGRRDSEGAGVDGARCRTAGPRPSVRQAGAAAVVRHRASSRSTRKTPAAGAGAPADTAPAAPGAAVRVVRAGSFGCRLGGRRPARRPRPDRHDVAGDARARRCARRRCRGRRSRRPVVPPGAGGRSRRCLDAPPARPTAYGPLRAASSGAVHVPRRLSSRSVRPVSSPRPRSSQVPMRSSGSAAT